MKDGIYQRGFNRSFGCLPEDVAVIIQYDGPIRFTAVAASVIRRHYAGRGELPVTLRREIFQIGERQLRAANWRLKEKGYYLTKSPATGNWTPLLYTYGVWSDCCRSRSIRKGL